MSTRKSPRLAPLGHQSKEADYDDDDGNSSSSEVETESDSDSDDSDSDHTDLPDFQSGGYLRRKGAIKLKSVPFDKTTDEYLYVMIGEKKNGKKVAGAGRRGKLAAQGNLVFPPTHYHDWMCGSRTAMCPESLKLVIPESLRFYCVANINHTFSDDFESITLTSDSPIETEEQLRLVLDDSLTSDYTLYNTNKCQGVLQPIGNGVTYQIYIPLPGGRGKKTLQRNFYRGSHDLASCSLPTYLTSKITKVRKGAKMGELGVVIRAHDELGAEDKAKVGPITITALDSFPQKNSYNFLGLKQLEKESIADLEAKLLRNDTCLNVRSPVQTAEELTAFYAKRNTERKSIRERSSTKKQAKHNKLTVTERTRLNKNGKKYEAKTSRRLYTDDEKATILHSMKVVNGNSKLTERTFTAVAKHLLEKSRKRGRDEDATAREIAAAQGVVTRFVGSGKERSKREETINGETIGKRVVSWRNKAETAEEKEDWTMKKR